MQVAVCGGLIIEGRISVCRFSNISNVITLSGMVNTMTPKIVFQGYLLLRNWFVGF